MRNAWSGMGYVRRPWLSRQGFHRWTESVPDPKHGDDGYYATICGRCGAKLCFSYGPHLVRHGRLLRRVRAS